MTEKKSTSAPERFRNYATIVYPDSALDNWQSILSDECIPSFISPIHDRDFDPTGEPKKPHYHVMFLFEGKKSEKQIKELVDKIGGVGIKVLNSVRGYARYLCHFDNPEKAQYSQEDVKQLAGADYSLIIGLASDKHKALAEMEEFCEKYDISSFYILNNYARDYRSDWHRILHDNGSVFMREYLKSRYWSIQNGITNIYDPETGEIMDFGKKL